MARKKKQDPIAALRRKLEGLSEAEIASRLDATLTAEPESESEYDKLRRKQLDDLFRGV